MPNQLNCRPSFLWSDAHPVKLYKVKETTRRWNYLDVAQIPSKSFAQECNADFTTANKKSSFSWKNDDCKIGASKCSEKNEIEKKVRNVVKCTKD